MLGIGQAGRVAERGVAHAERPGAQGHHLREAILVAPEQLAQGDIAADILLPFFGLAMELGPIAEWGLGLDRNHILVEAASCATNVPGVFAVGDVATYPGKLKLILQGFSECAMAAHAIHPLIYPDVALHFEYSTTKGVPAAA